MDDCFRAKTSVDKLLIKIHFHIWQAPSHCVFFWALIFVVRSVYARVYLRPLGRARPLCQGSTNLIGQWFWCTKHHVLFGQVQEIEREDLSLNSCQTWDLCLNPWLSFWPSMIITMRPHLCIDCVHTYLPHLVLLRCISVDGRHVSKHETSML
ncbi:hypothetical protein BCR43DRAFT_141315 [Syncephalastrum racemosum]|uniref:Uncharacterized protein n=1 Tax=Syncephalastrum racemosum TaxID=13706 RepID=A0A1X2HM54_SYNRA|nr:hypothetical protein BCR43DRAFT_141315 [Syncephalastrum racemosum]